VPDATHLSHRARSAVFAPLDQDSRAEIVARRLSDAIALGLLRDGAQLPSESDLAARFGVATVTVREALTTLRHRGLLETRRGRGGGSFVTAPKDPARSVLLARLAEVSALDLRDLGDHYAALGGSAARLAAERAGPEDLERLEEAMKDLDNATSARERRRAEGQFHVEVAAAAQSARLTREEIRLQTEVGPLLWLALDDVDAHASACAQHRAVARAIARGHRDKARSLAEEHILDTVARALSLQRTGTER
jgi:GntR family transcriptional regulator, transcriptional repressor for pyruvate dehydrogenase complex